MIRVQSAISRYERQLRPRNADSPFRGYPALMNWLTADVVPAVEELLGEKRFQELALFPLERLTGRTDSDEFAAVREVCGAIAILASALRDWLADPSHHQRLLGLDTYRLWASLQFRDTSEISIDSTLSLLTTISSLSVADFVAQEDYFQPQAGLIPSNRPTLRTTLLTPAFSPELRSPGDMVFRCLGIRIQHWSDVLHRFQNASRIIADGGSHAEEIARRNAELRIAQDAFDKVVVHSKQRWLGESAVVLVQTYAAIRGLDALGWLKLSPSIQRPVGLFHIWLRRDEGVAITDRIAEALQKVEETLSRSVSQEEMVDRLKGEKRIVMVGREKEIYFDGYLLVGEENSLTMPQAQLELLLKLIEFASRGEHVTRDHLSRFRSSGDRFGGPSWKAVRDRRSKLGKRIPRALNELVISRVAHSYSLNLRPDDIAIIPIPDDFR